MILIHAHQVEIRKDRMLGSAGRSWIPVQRIEAVLQLEGLLTILAFSLVTWLLYRFLLRKVSAERHRNMARYFKNLSLHIIGLAACSAVYFLSPDLLFVHAYSGLATLIWGSIVIVKTSRIFVFEYLFLGHMQQGVPLLLVNIFSLILSITIGVWFATEVFQLQITSVIATSAVFSVVIGLAAQETLGNLFSGAALQFDKPYEIGDWVEVSNGSQKWVGQVYEISWRAVLLKGLGHELITVPNRTMAQSQIANFTSPQAPVLRTQIFKIPYEASDTHVRRALLQSVQGVAGIRLDETPVVFAGEAHESWMSYKLIYSIDNYGAQFAITDQVLSNAINELKKSGLTIAPQRISVLTEKSS